MLASLLTLCVLAAPPARSQEPATQPATQPTTVPIAEELTVATVQRRLETLDANASLDEAVKNRARDLYNRAIEYLTAAEQWSAKAAQWRQTAEAAPQEIEQTRATLSQPPEPVQVSVGPDETIEQLEQRRTARSAELKAAQEQLKQIQDRLVERTPRRAKLPDDLADANRRLAQVQSALTTPAGEESTEVRAARETMLRAQKKQIEAEIAAYEQEGLTFDIRGDLLTVRRDRLTREVSALEERLRKLEEIITEQRRAEAQTQAQAAARARREAAQAHPLVRQITQQSAELTRERADAHLPDKIDAKSALLKQLSDRLDALDKDRKQLEAQVEAIGLTPAIGMRLRALRSQLREARDYERAVANRQAEIARAYGRLLELRDKDADITDPDAVARRLTADLAPGMESGRLEELRAAIREAVQAQRDYVRSFLGEYERYVGVLNDLDSKQRVLIAFMREFRSFIDQRILWVRSAPPFGLDDLRDVPTAVRGLADPQPWISAGRAVWPAMRGRPGLSATGLLAFLALLGLRPRLRRTLRAAGETAEKKYAQSFTPTALAALYTLLLAAPWPLLLGLVGWLLVSEPATPDFARAVGSGLVAVALAVFTAELIRRLCRAKGLAESHLDWPAKSVRRIRRHVVWLLTFGAPVLFLASVVEWSGDQTWKNSVGRMLFTVGQLLLAVFFWRMFRSGTGALRQALAGRHANVLLVTRTLVYPLSVGVPIVLIGLSLAGYHYSATKIFQGFVASLWLVLALSLLYFLALRWLLVAHRKLAIEQARQRREAAKVSGKEAVATEAEPAPEPEIDVSSVSAQARSVTASAIVLALILGLWFVWDDVLPGLAFLDHVTLWTTTTQVTETTRTPEGDQIPRTFDAVTPITLADGVLAAVIVLITFIVARNAPGLLEIAVLQRLPVQPGGRYAIATVSRYLITIVGIVLAFGAIGVGWSKVQWLAAAATVGLGFGLQEIFANFVSGLIILFERPIRVGDVVTVGGIEGKVMRIRIRATTILDWDRRELLVPNKEFITGQLINWTLTDPVTRIIVPVGIAYGSDTALAKRLLLKVAYKNALVLDEPKPYVIFIGFGDSALNFELRVFIPTRDIWPEIMDQLHTEVDNEFRTAGVEIAFPQRDIHVRSIRASLPVAQTERPATAPAE